MVVVTGAAGQLGTDVAKELERRGMEHIGIDIAELDITDGAAVNEYLRGIKSNPTALRATPFSKGGEGQVRICVIHCAAYTAVDKAEDEMELCFKVNAAGTENLAKACREIDAEMIYISTDYVFSGEGEMPYETDAVKEPLSTYGKSKLAGEDAVLRHLEKHYIVRISWVFGENGPNFVKTMLKLAETRDEINVVGDQVGSPTYTPDLAKLLCDMALSGKYGVYHATNEGFCSWAEFAEEIMRLKAADKRNGEDKGIEKRAAHSAMRDDGYVRINRIATEEYPTKAPRPKNSRLSKRSLIDAGFKRLPGWQDALVRFLADVHNDTERH